MKLPVSFVVITIVMFFAIEILLQDVVIAGFTAVTVSLVYNLLASAISARKIIPHGKKSLFLLIAGVGIVGQFLANNLQFDTLHAQTSYLKAAGHLESLTKMHLSVQEVAGRVINKINEEKQSGNEPGINKIFFSLYSQNKSGMLTPLYNDQSLENGSDKLLPVYLGRYSDKEIHIVVVDPEGKGFNPDFKNRNFLSGMPEYEAVLSSNKITFSVRN